MSVLELKVGSPVWVWDENCRVYRKSADGRSTGGVIWREHWQKKEITSETRISWVIGENHWNQIKFPKRNPREKPWLFCFSEEELDQRCYVAENRHRIASALQNCEDYAMLKTVARAIGYEERS